MKRILSLVLACALVLGCVFALASCEKFVETLRGIADGSANGPASDYKKAAEALEDADYDVDCIDDEDELEIYASYMDLEGLEALIEAVDEDEENMIAIYYFDSKEDAEEAYETMEEYFEQVKEMMAEEDIEIVIEQSGKMIWMGTEAAIKAAK